MKKQTKRKSRKEQLQEEIDKIIPDREEQKAMINGLYQGNPLFGERGLWPKRQRPPLLLRRA